VAFSNNVSNPNTGNIWLSASIPGPDKTFSVTNEWAQPGSFLPIATTNLEPPLPIWISLLLPLTTSSVDFERLASPTFIPFNSALDITNGISKFPIRIEANQASPHDEVPSEIINSLDNVISQVFGSPENIAPNELFNFTSLQGNVIRKDIVVFGKFGVNLNGFSGLSSNPQPESPTNLFRLSTKPCDPITINIENGGKLEIGDIGSSGDLNTKLILKSGDLMHIKNNSTFIIANNSELTIENGAKLIIEPNANIDLAGTNSRIVVKNGGELIINGQFDLTGSGHFYFEAGNIFTLNNNLEITGLGTQVPRFVLANGAKVLINQNVQLKLTNTQVLCDGSFAHLNFSGNATFEALNVRFSNCSIVVDDADDANPAPSDLEFSLKDCIFENSTTTTAFEAFDERGSQAPQAADFGNIDYKFENCQFINCPSSILVQRAQTFQMLSCSTANIEMLNTYFLDLENTRVIGGVKTSKVGHFRLMNSVIDGGNVHDLNDATRYGIHTTSGYLWALVMLNSTVQNCDRAIKFDGGVWQSNGARIGLLHMDCSALINNKTGIKGTDIIFSIYSRYNNIGETANIFTQNSQAQYPDDYLIDAVFNDRPDLDTDLWFHGNYWNGGTPPSSSVNTFWRLRTKIVSPPKFDPWFGTIHTTPVRTNLDPSVVQCGGVSLRNDPQNPLSIGTVVNVNGILRDVKVQQDAGWRELNGQNLKSAVALLRPVAHLATTITDTANAQVKHLVEVARELALETPNSSGRADKGTAADGWVEASFMGYANPRTGMDIVVSPNPAHTTFQLELPEGEFTVDVFNALGNRVYQKTVYTEGVINIDVTTWQNAFYLVQVVNTQTKEKAIRKIVVQH
jgi:hypothetical protein